jgi:hypothetical protein
MSHSIARAMVELSTLWAAQGSRSVLPVKKDTRPGLCKNWKGNGGDMQRHEPLEGVQSGKAQEAIGFHTRGTRPGSYHGR